MTAGSEATATTGEMGPRRPRRLTLRWRVALTFGLISLVLSGVLGVVTVRLASGYMIDQRQQSANVQASVNRQLILSALTSGSDGVDDLLDGFTGDPGTTVLLGSPGNWTTSGRRVDPGALPADLIDGALQGSTVIRRGTFENLSTLVVALPVRSGELFIELFPLAEFERIYRYLTIVVAIGVVAAGLGGIALGWWAGRRALRPLTLFNTAAARVAAGDLHARLPEDGDPDLSQIAETFNATTAALEQRVARDTRFAGDVSHELRSPLTTMVNAVELLRHRRDQLPDTAGQAVDLLYGETQRFQQMVLDLLEISRSDQALDERAWESVDLLVLVRNVARTVAGVPEPIKEGVPPPVLADRRRLMRVVANLVENAVTHGGGVVRLLVTQRGTCVRLEVDDAGPGIPDEYKQLVFERFSRAGLAGTRPETGTGLGLALVAQHVRTHQGTTWVQDRPGGGATFVVELPATAGP